MSVHWKQISVVQWLDIWKIPHIHMHGHAQADTDHRDYFQFGAAEHEFHLNCIQNKQTKCNIYNKILQ